MLRNGLLVLVFWQLHYYNFLHKHLDFLGNNIYQLISPRLLMTFFLNANLFFVNIFFIFIISIIGNAVLSSCDNWSKKNLIRCRIKELFDITQLIIIGVQRYNKSPPRKWTLKVARLNFQGNFRSTLERCLPTCVSFTFKSKTAINQKGLNTKAIYTL